MSLASEIAQIDAGVVANVPVADNLITSITAAAQAPATSDFHRALNVVGALAMATQAVPNADVEAIGGLAGIVAALLNLIPIGSQTAAMATATTALTAHVSARRASFGTVVHDVFHPQAAAQAVEAQEAKPA